MAVLKSNVAACYLGLEEWKEAADRATEALEGLERLVGGDKDGGDESKHETGQDDGTAAVNGVSKRQHQERRNNQPQSPKSSSLSPSSRGGKDSKGVAESGTVVEIPTDQEHDESAFLHRLAQTDARNANISRLRIKTLLRRARARHKQQTWSSLSGAQEDYNTLFSLVDPRSKSKSESPSENTSDPQLRKTIATALAILPREIDAAKEREMGEMMGKLKDLGNGILKPFGLSTDNFKMVKDEKTGGYSMNFQGNQ